MNNTLELYSSGFDTNEKGQSLQLKIKKYPVKIISSEPEQTHVIIVIQLIWNVEPLREIFLSDKEDFSNNSILGIVKETIVQYQAANKEMRIGGQDKQIMMGESSLNVIETELQKYPKKDKATSLWNYILKSLLTETMNEEIAKFFPLNKQSVFECSQLRAHTIKIKTSQKSTLEISQRLLVQNNDTIIELNEVAGLYSKIKGPKQCCLECNEDTLEINDHLTFRSDASSYCYYAFQMKYDEINPKAKVDTVLKFLGKNEFAATNMMMENSSLKAMILKEKDGRGYELYVRQEKDKWDFYGEELYPVGISTVDMIRHVLKNNRYPELILVENKEDSSDKFFDEEELKTMRLSFDKFIAGLPQEKKVGHMHGLKRNLEKEACIICDFLEYSQRNMSQSSNKQNGVVSAYGRFGSNGVINKDGFRSTMGTRLV